MLGYIKGLLDIGSHVVLFQNKDGANIDFCEDSNQLDAKYRFYTSRGYNMVCTSIPK